MTEAADNHRDRLPAGTVVGGRFEVRSFIAKGGMGHVYRAVQRPLDRTVALKIMRRELVDDPNGRRRFAQEALAVSRLNHPNTVRVYDVGELSEGRFFIAMEFVEGVPLHEEIHRLGRVPPARALKILRQIAESLGEAHKRQIIHRDLKPDNILLTRIGEEDDFVKVLDFGIARVLDEETTTRITVAGYVCGTPEYMAPEQARGEDIDGRADLYALGVLLYEMLSGSIPFQGSTPLSTLLAHQNDPVPPLPADVPRAVADVCMRLLQKPPDDRPHDAATLLTVIDLALTELDNLDELDEPTLDAETLSLPAVERQRPATDEPGRASNSPRGGRPSSIIIDDELDEDSPIEGIPSATLSVHDIAATPPSGRKPALPWRRLAVPGAVALGIALAVSVFGLARCGEDETTPATGHLDPSTLPAPPDEPAPPGTARLPVLSDPPGVEVRLDGQHVGSTPLFVQRPRDEAVLLEFSRDGFRPQTRVLPLLEPGEVPDTLEIVMEPDMHEVSFRTRPEGAEVRIEGSSSPFCQTPCEHRFPAGSGPWHIEFSLPGHESRTLIVEQSGQEYTLVAATLTSTVLEDESDATTTPRIRRRDPGRSRVGDPFAGERPAPSERTDEERENGEPFRVIDRR